MVEGPGLRPRVGGGGVQSTVTVFTRTRYRKRVSTVGIGYLGRVWVIGTEVQAREIRYELETWECIRSITLVSSVSSQILTIQSSVMVPVPFGKENKK